MDVKDLKKLALEKGASEAAYIATADIKVEDDLAGLCRDPGCMNYGLSHNCPPHVFGPAGFRELLKNYEHAFFFKIEVPTEYLLSEDRLDIFKLLHEIASGIEQAAVSMGYDRARAFAGGSCKQIFCRDHAACRVLEEGGPCRNPESARPSMSGFGINVPALNRQVGWEMDRITSQTRPEEVSMGKVCGLVLIS